MKRLLDVCLAVILLLLALPVLAVACFAIRINSPGRVIFAQLRLGQNERAFTCYKLRTMFVGAPQVGTHELTSDTVTSVGKVLRRLKIDEIPQLWNVLRGEMSLVGPRPCLPTQTVLIACRRARSIFVLRPGITGAAQVMGVDMSTPEILAEIEAEYLRKASLRTDLRILFETLLGRGAGDRVLDT